MSEQTVVTVINDGLVTECIICDSPEAGERAFLATCSQCISNWDEYSPEDIEAVIAQGYERFGEGAVCFVNPEEL